MFITIIQNEDWVREEIKMGPIWGLRILGCWIMEEIVGNGRDGELTRSPWNKTAALSPGTYQKEHQFILHPLIHTFIRFPSHFTKDLMYLQEYIV